MLILPPGHARSVASPRRRLVGRERWFVAGAALVATVLMIAIAVSLASGTSAPRKGCLDVTFASSMGAGDISGCGAVARATCAALGTPSGYSGDAGRLLADRCRQLGFTVGQ